MKLKIFSIDETDYTSTLKSSIDSYISEKFPNQDYGRSYTPHSAKQGFKTLESKSQCFDLIKRIIESSLLILEIKVTINLLRLIAYSHRQHELNSILRELGIPVEYCYNLTDDYAKHSDSEYVLVNSNTSSPETICDNSGRFIHKELHVTLKSLIDNMVSNAKEGGSSGESTVGAIFSEGFVERLQDIDLRMIFFAFNAKTGEAYVLDKSELTTVYKTYSNYVNERPIINLKTAPLHEVKQYFLESKKVLHDAVSVYEKDPNLLQHKEQKAPVITPKVKSPVSELKSELKMEHNLHLNFKPSPSFSPRPIKLKY